MTSPQIKASAPAHESSAPAAPAAHLGKPYTYGEYAPVGVVLRQWWNVSPNRPGQAWQQMLATGFYNTLIGCVLSVFFVLNNPKTSAVSIFIETILISQCIGFSIHLGFESLFKFTSAQWRESLPKPVWRAIMFAVPIVGVYVGYTVAFAFKGKNFLDLLVRFPRSGAMIMFIGLGVSFVWYIIMDGQTRRLRAEAEEAKARADSAALQKQASESELRALQAQIEPHFLFNTLAGVQALIDYEPAKAKSMLEAFIEYLRATLDASRRTQSSLGDEVQLLQRYLALMQIRMGERLQFEFEVDDTLKSMPFAPLLLQPLVENAIKYGLEPKIEGGTVLVSAKREGSTVCLSVHDNGVGLGQRSTARKGAGVGLNNVRERSLAMFGPSAKVEITAAQPGTLATISFEIKDQ